MVEDTEEPVSSYIPRPRDDEAIAEAFRLRHSRPPSRGPFIFVWFLLVLSSLPVVFVLSIYDANQLWGIVRTLSGDESLQKIMGPLVIPLIVGCLTWMFLAVAVGFSVAKLWEKIGKITRSIAIVVLIIEGLVLFLASPI